MGMFKKNWGFIVISFVCFLLACYMIVRCSGTKEKMNTSKSEYEKKLSYLDGVGKKRLKLTEDNIKLARKNSDVTTSSLNSVYNEMMSRFKLKYKVPVDAPGVLRELREAILAMQKQLEEKEIVWDSKVEYFSFDLIARSTTLPPKDDFDPIFRQLAIVKEVVKVAIASNVLAINEINRPMGLKVQEEAEYTITPIEITITASPENGQNFINAMSNQEKFIFFLRTIEISAPDVTTEVAKDLGSRSSSGGRGGMRVGGIEDEPRSSRRGQGSAGRGKAQENQDGLVDIPRKRQELLVFDQKEVTLKLRFDFIEPKYALPEENKADE